MRAHAKATFLLTVVATAFVVVPGFTEATHAPADKVAVFGSTAQILNDVTVDSVPKTVKLFTDGVMRTSNPTDLIFTVTLECALWTNLQTVGNDEAEAIATVKVWITVDGVPVIVSGGDTEESGKVVFCNRAYRSATSNFEDRDATIQSFLATRHANAFQWVKLNAGSGTHTINAWATLDTKVTGTAFAKAVVGKRTMTVTPVKLANDVTL